MKSDRDQFLQLSLIKKNNKQDALANIDRTWVLREFNANLFYFDTIFVEDKGDKFLINMYFKKRKNMNRAMSNVRDFLRTYSFMYTLSTSDKQLASVPTKSSNDEVKSDATLQELGQDFDSLDIDAFTIVKQSHKNEPKKEIPVPKTRQPENNSHKVEIHPWAHQWNLFDQKQESAQTTLPKQKKSTPFVNGRGNKTSISDLPPRIQQILKNTRLMKYILRSEIEREVKFEENVLDS